MEWHHEDDLSGGLCLFFGMFTVGMFSVHKTLRPKPYGMYTDMQSIDPLYLLTEIYDKMSQTRTITLTKIISSWNLSNLGPVLMASKLLWGGTAFQGWVAERRCVFPLLGRASLIISVETLSIGKESESSVHWEEYESWVGRLQLADPGITAVFRSQIVVIKWLNVYKKCFGHGKA